MGFLLARGDRIRDGRGAERQGQNYAGVKFLSTEMRYFLWLSPLPMPETRLPIGAILAPFSAQKVDALRAPSHGRACSVAAPGGAVAMIAVTARAEKKDLPAEAAQDHADRVHRRGALHKDPQTRKNSTAAPDDEIHDPSS
jgi:hypothetical protein